MRTRSVCRSTSALMSAWRYSREAFSCPSVMIPTMTVPGRTSSGMAARRCPAVVTRRPIESSRAVEPLGSSTRLPISSTGRSA